MITIKDYSTGKVIARINKKELNVWCSKNDYLPHHKTKVSWFVIAK